MIGDSLAVGVGQARPECETMAQVGITSERYLTSMMPPGRTMVETAVISLGVNDGESADTLGNLREVRARISGRRVYWLLPGIKERVRDMIRTVAAENGDQLIDTRPHVGRDHLHPNGAGYQMIASHTYGDEGVGEEVALDTPRAGRSYEDREPDLRRPLRAYATPRERIRRLRALRHMEGTYRVSGRGHGEHRGVMVRSVMHEQGARHGPERLSRRGDERIRERGPMRVSISTQGGRFAERQHPGHGPVRTAASSCGSRPCGARGHAASVRGRG